MTKISTLKKRLMENPKFRKEYEKADAEVSIIEALIHASRSLQSICKDDDFVIRFSRMACGGGNDGCEGDFGKEVCCAAER